MQVGLGLMVAWLSAVWMCMEAWFADRDHMFTAEQMLYKHPQHPQGLPFLWHGGMWGDLFIITPILGIIVALYASQWSLLQVSILMGVGMVMSIGMHVIYLQTPFPDCLAWKGGMSPAGVLHIPYMGGALGVIGLFLFCTRGVPNWNLVAIGIALTVHIAIGNHMLLGWVNTHLHFPWCPEFLRRPDPWVTTGAVCAILAGSIWWYTGSWQATVGMVVISWFIILIPISIDGLMDLGRRGVH